MSKIYIRKFSESKARKGKVGDYRISGNFPEYMGLGLLEAIKDTGNIRVSDYIIGPLYQRGAFQIGMTGTVEIGETRLEGMTRELGEELGLLPEYESDLDLILEHQEYSKKCTVYDLFINHAKYVPITDNGKKMSKNPDNKNMKVGCYVYGKKDKVLSFLNQESINIYKSDDEIIGIVAISVKSVLGEFNVLI